MLDDDNALFSMEPPVATVLEDMKISKEQLEGILDACSRAGVTDPVAQRDLIRNCVVRPFESLQDLLSKDFRSILQRIEAKSTGTSPLTGSAWDNREGDTWIDKM